MKKKLCITLIIFKKCVNQIVKKFFNIEFEFLTESDACHLTRTLPE